MFDTNILISAIALPGGRAEEALRCIIDGRHELVISKPIIGELLTVLARKFSRDADELSRVAVFLDDLAEIVQPDRRLKILADDPDNRILECAVTGIAELIVTGDKAMLELKNYRDVRILSLRKFLDG